MMSPSPSEVNAGGCHGGPNAPNDETFRYNSWCSRSSLAARSWRKMRRSTKAQANNRTQRVELSIIRPSPVSKLGATPCPRWRERHAACRDKASYRFADGLRVPEMLRDKFV